MARETVVNPPQELANEHTLLAQKYAGYLVGHPYRQTQMTTLVTVDRQKSWREPSVVADDCIFCARLTDEEAERRVLGYQYQIDVETTRLKHKHFDAWLVSGSSDIPEPGVATSKANLRRFCELFQDMPTARRPKGWNTRPLPFFKLPLRLKRKLCIEWNHLYIGWLSSNTDVQYDFERHEFYREVPDSQEDEQEGC